MSGPPSDATIWTRERRYFFTSRSQSTKTTFMRSSPPHAGDLTHLVRGRGDLEAALHAPGERLHQVIAPLPQLEHPQQDFTPLPPGVPRHAVQHPVDIHVLPCRELAVETRILEDDAEPLADCRLMRGDIES